MLTGPGAGGQLKAACAVGAPTGVRGLPVCSASAAWRSSAALPGASGAQAAVPVAMEEAPSPPPSAPLLVVLLLLGHPLCCVELTPQPSPEGVEAAPPASPLCVRSGARGVTGASMTLCRHREGQ